MAKKDIKISREELETDETIEFIDHVIFFLKTHGNKILTVICIGFLIYAGFVFIHQQKESKLRNASDELYSAMLTYDKALGESWGSEERKNELTKVIDQADAVISKYEGTEVAEYALFLKGNAYYFMGDQLGETANTDQAIEIFLQYDEDVKGKEDKFDHASALVSLGYAKENLSMLTEASNSDVSDQALKDAVAYYNEVIAMNGSGFLKYEAMNALARLSKKTGDIDQAKELYTLVLKENYSEPEEPEEGASRREQTRYELRLMSNQFTSGNSARSGLLRLGMTPEEIDAIIKGESEDAGES